MQPGACTHQADPGPGSPGSSEEGAEPPCHRPFPLAGNDAVFDAAFKRSRDACGSKRWPTLFYCAQALAAAAVPQDPD